VTARPLPLLFLLGLLAGGCPGGAAWSPDAWRSEAAPGADLRQAEAGVVQPGREGGVLLDGSVLPPMKTQAFLIGYNEAWFGSAFGTDYTTAFDLPAVRKTLDGIVAGGGHLVRL